MDVKIKTYVYSTMFGPDTEITVEVACTASELFGGEGPEWLHELGRRALTKCSPKKCDVADEEKQENF